MSSPFTNYDAWLTTDRLADAAEAHYVHVLDAWQEYAEDNGLPYEISDEDHPDHAIYTLWEALFNAVEAYGERLLAESEAAYYEAEAAQEEHLAQLRDEEQMVLDSQVGIKILRCVVCDARVEVPPSADRVWCREHAG